jgi:di/tripeptidase
LPKEPKATYNVGVIHGGTTVNTIASEREIPLDTRSVDMRCLANLERKVLAIVGRQAKDGDGRAKLERVGDRPAGVIPTNHPLAQTCRAIYLALGITTSNKATSMEANVSLSMGTPRRASPSRLRRTSTGWTSSSRRRRSQSGSRLSC